MKRRAKDSAGACGWPMVRVGMLLVGLGVSSVAAAQGITMPPTVGSSKNVANAVPGDRITFTAHGKSYSAILVQTVPGKGGQLDLHEVADIKLLPPPGPGEPATPGTATTAGTLGTPAAAGGASPTQGAGGAAGSGIGAAATGAAIALTGYIAVPPGLRRELSESQAALDAAIRAGQAQVVLYTSALSSRVAGAVQATQALRSAAVSTSFSSVPEPVALAGAALPDFSAAPWPLRSSLELSWEVLTNTPIQSAAHGQVRNMGLHALGSAQESLRGQDIEGATVAAKLAEAAAWVARSGAAELLISFNPLASLARDATELMTGKDLLSGEVLSEADLWMRAVSLGAGLVTGGAASTLRQALSRVAPVVDRANITRRLLDTFVEVGSHIRRRWVERAGKALTKGTDDEIRDLVFRGIREGAPYWDAKEKNVAFFLKASEKKWLQVAVDLEKGKAVTLTPRGVDFDWHEVLKVPDQIGGFPKRWVPIEIPVKASPPSLKLGLPGKP